MLLAVPCMRSNLFVMKPKTLLFPFLFCLLFHSLTAWAWLPAPNGDKGDGDELSHIDYLPRYRKTNLNTLITKLEYYNSKIIIHFRYIADQKAPIRFYGKNLPNAWSLATPKRPGTTQQPIEKTGDVYNIRINDKLQLAELSANDEVSYTPEKGDVVSCEIHVENLPHFIKVVNLEGGEMNEKGEPRFLCTDIMLKSADNKTLGTPQQMETLIGNFYQEFKYIRYPDIKEVTSLEQERKFEEKRIATTGNTTPIKNSMKPIDYMPTMLNSVEDLQCKERVILQNVYFDDNSAEFSKRVQAMKTINVVFNYLEMYPDAKIVLHGHTDIFGDPYKNLVLSKERVLTVKRTLVQKGIDKKRVITLYHGGSQPLPRYKDGDPMNRRVEVEVICKDDAISVSGDDSD